MEDYSQELSYNAYSPSEMGSFSSNFGFNDPGRDAQRITGRSNRGGFVSPVRAQRPS